MDVKKIRIALWRGSARLVGLLAFCVSLPARLLRALSDGLHFRASLAGFQVRPDDVFLVTYPKSGTTVLQMLLYQLTTDGSDTFHHITDHSPYFESEIGFGRGDRFDNLPSPRVFKTHLRLDQLPRGARYLHVTRDPRDVLVSYFHHARLIDDFAGTLEQFGRLFLAGRGVAGGSWFKHLETALEPDGRAVLYLSYAELTGDLAGVARRVAAFCGLALDERDLPRIVRNCGFEAMRALEAKFDPRMTGTGRFIRQGGVGGWKQEGVPPPQLAALEARLTRLARTAAPASEEARALLAALAPDRRAEDANGVSAPAPARSEPPPGRPPAPNPHGPS